MSEKCDRAKSCRMVTVLCHSWSDSGHSSEMLCTAYICGIHVCTTTKCINIIIQKLQDCETGFREKQNMKTQHSPSVNV